MAAAGAGEAGEAGGRIAATTECLNGGDGFRPERAHGRAVLFLVTGNKIIPATVDNLPEGRRPRAPRMVNGGRGGHALTPQKSFGETLGEACAATVESGIFLGGLRM